MLVFGIDESLELRHRHGRGLGVQLEHRFAHRCRLDRRVQRAVQRCEDLRRRAGWCHDAQPTSRVNGNALLCHGLQVRRAGEAAGRRQAERLQLAALDEAVGCRHRDHHRVHLPGDHGQHCRRGPQERHVQHLDLRLLHVYFHPHMRRAADAPGGESDLTRTLRRLCGELGNAAARERRIHHQRIGEIAGNADRNEILARVVGKLGIYVRIDGVRVGCDPDQRVAVLGRARDDVAADGTVRAGTVVDHHGLLQPLAHALGDDARNHVAAAARRPGNDETDGFVRILRRSGRRQHCRPSKTDDGNGANERLNIHDFPSLKPRVGSNPRDRKCNRTSIFISPYRALKICAYPQAAG